MLRIGFTNICFFLTFSVFAQSNLQIKAEKIKGEFIIKIDEFERKQTSNSKILTKSALDNLENVKNVTQVRKPNQEVISKPSVLDGIYKVSIQNDEDLSRICDSLAQFGNVVYIEPVYREQLLDIPNDPAANPQTGNQSYLSVIKAYEAWNISKSNDSIVIGIIDSGADLDHIDFKDKIYQNDKDPINGIDDDLNGYIDDFYGYDFADKDNNANADGGPHGTRVSGIAGASTNNGVGIAGVGYNARFAPLKIFKTSDQQSIGGYEAIQYAADNGFAIINLSWGSVDTYSQYSQDIINYAALEKNVVVVAAAGNTLGEYNYYPASYDNVLSVGISNNDDTKSFMTSYSAFVDILAPGIGAYSTINDDLYGTDNGSSYSAPMAAGVAALMKSSFPKLSAVQIIERIRATSDNIYHLDANKGLEGKLGKGRLNAFRAVNEQKVIAIRAKKPTITSTFNQIYFGDTININFEITNYLDPAIHSSIVLKILSDKTSISSDEIMFNYLSTLESKSLESIEIVLDDSISPGTRIEYQLNFKDESGYNDVQLFDFYTAPDYLDFGNDSLKLTIAGNGNIGYANDNFQNGLGIEWRGKRLLKQMGLFFSLDSISVIDNLPGSTGTRNSDFSVNQHIKPFKYESSDHYAFNSFQGDSNNLKLLIDQNSLAVNSQDIVLLSYRLSNNNSDTLFNLKGGLFMNWDIDEKQLNRSTWDNSKTGYVENGDGSLFAGVRAIGNDSIFFNAIDIASLVDSLSDKSIYELTHKFRHDSSGFNAYVDAAFFLGFLMDTMPPYSSKQISFAIGAANSLPGLKTLLGKGDSIINLLISHPPIVKSISSCEGGIVNFLPDSGQTYLFFSDAFGKDTLKLNDSTSISEFLKIGPINGDTIIYFAKFDTLIAGAIKAVSIKLFSDIANFELEHDTLFLGDNLNNAIQLKDKSLEPVEWRWDFDNNSKAIGLANPITKYDSIGIYNIALEVTNAHGCIDTIVKKLVVMERPQPPQIPNQIICGGQEILIESQKKDTLRYYVNPQANQFEKEGSLLSLGVIEKDSTFYFTRVSNNLESHKISVSVKLGTVDINTELFPVLDSLHGNYAMIITTEINIDSINWALEKINVSNNDTLIFEVINDTILLDYFIRTREGCSVSVTDSLIFNSGPIPSFSDTLLCRGNSVRLNPSGGSLFGFYTDSLLIQPIAKGEFIMIDSLKSDTLFYITNLDSLLPSNPKKVILNIVDFRFNIIADPDTLLLDKGRMVNFSISKEASSYSWFVNGSLIDTSPAPTFFYDTAGVYTVEVEAVHAAGCYYRDSISLLVLETEIIEILGFDDSPEFPIYPNPVENLMTIISKKKIEKIEIYSYDGKIIHSFNYPSFPIDMTFLSAGIYLLRIATKDESRIYKVLKTN